MSCFGVPDFQRSRSGLRRKGPGQQFIEPRLRMTSGKRLEGGAQIGVGIDVVELASLDERSDASSAGAALVVAAK